MHFESENLDSIKQDKGFEITLRSMLAQDESRNISENIQWGTTTIQKMLKNEKYKGDTLLQKTYTEDFMTGKKVKNIGQRTKYFVSESHPAIVAEIFDRVQEEMAKRSRVIHNEDGTVSSSDSKYNGKYLLGNLLVCGDCGASYRIRTERGKVVWRCATRIEKGKEACVESPTINEECIKEKLANAVCTEFYDENALKGKVSKISIHNEYIVVKGKNDAEWVFEF